MPNINLLQSDKATPFSSYNFGNISAGATSSQQLVFVNSYASGTASGAAFGISNIAGNDGYSYCQISSASTFNASGSAVTGSTIATGGAIASAATLRYAISIKDNWGYESDPFTGTTFTPSLSGTSTNLVSLNWTPVSGTSQYGVYLSTDSGTSYKLVGFTANAFYTDTSGTATATNPAASGSTGYRPSTWGTAALSLGNLASGTMIPVIYDEVVPSGTSSTGNPRQHYLYTSFLST